jgi:hypothetical protein
MFSYYTQECMGLNRDLNISAKDIANLAYSELSPHLKEKLESHAFSNVSQVLQRAMDYETRAV